MGDLWDCHCLFWPVALRLSITKDQEGMWVGVPTECLKISRTCRNQKKITSMARYNVGSATEQYQEHALILLLLLLLLSLSLYALMFSEVGT